MRRQGVLELQPAFQGFLHIAENAVIKLSWSLADEFRELHRLDALGIDEFYSCRHDGRHTDEIVRDESIRWVAKKSVSPQA